MIPGQVVQSISQSTHTFSLEIIFSSGVAKTYACCTCCGCLVVVLASQGKIVCTCLGRSLYLCIEEDFAGTGLKGCVKYRSSEYLK